MKKSLCSGLPLSRGKQKVGDHLLRESDLLETMLKELRSKEEVRNANFTPRSSKPRLIVKLIEVKSGYFNKKVTRTLK